MKIAIIPARGGSKRIPRKNIKFFGGKPIIAWSILAARESKLFDHIIVSTDDEDIASIAKDYGAEVPFIRPDNLSDDITGTADVIKHAVSWCIKNIGEVESVCTLYATAPFITVNDIKNGYDLLMKNNCKIVFTVTSFPFPIQRAVKLDDNHRVSMFQPKYFLSRSQDLESAYHDAGQLYWATAQAVFDNTPTFSEDSLAQILPRHQVQDIDEPEDWDRAELMFKAWHANNNLK